MNPRRKSRSRKPARRARNEPRRPAVNLTGEQIAARYRAENEESERRMCTLNLFWMDCSNKACQRVRRCAGDPFKCFNERWWSLSEGERQYRRDWMLELHRTQDFEKAFAFARARAAERQRVAEQFAAATAAIGGRG